MQSTQLPKCAYCLYQHVNKKGRKFCSHSCAAKARTARSRSMVCSVADCMRVRRCNGMCDMHNQRMRKNGHLRITAPGRGVPLEDRFWIRVEVSGPDDCWLWRGELVRTGYGVLYEYVAGRRIRHPAHRFSVSLREPLVDGLVVMHTCDTPACVNPKHLRQVTQADNVRDAYEKGRMNMGGLVIGQKMSTRDALEISKRRKMLKGMAA